MRKTFLVGALAASAACLAVHAQNAPETAPAAPAAAPMEVTPEQKAEYLRTFGWNVGTNLGQQFVMLDMSEAEVAEFIKGFTRGMEGKDAGTKEPLEKIASNIDGFLQGRAKEWEQKNKDFLRQVDKMEGIQQSASGLRYKVLEKGKSPMPNKSSTVKAIYKGTLFNGHVFDSTEKHGTPFDTFALNQVIPGWTEGLQKIGKGGKIQLYIPHEIGYGEQGSRGGIPPFSTLIFEVEIVDVTDAPPAPAPAPTVTPAPAAQ